jgi:uncharacterized surface protein with fasciclin (FAS1) repeats
MKLGVLLLLLALLVLTWIATRDNGAAEVAGAATPDTTLEGYPAPESAYPAPGGEAALTPPSNALMIDPPADTVPSGDATFSGTAAPGTQVIILVDGQPAGAATAGVDGAWSAVVPLSAGDYVVQVQAVDNVGAVVGESEPVEVVVEDSAAGAPPAETAIDPVSGDYILSGTAAPGSTITLSSGGAVVGTAVAGEDGAWSVVVPAAAVADAVEVQTTDASGVAQPPATVPFGPQPPFLNAPGEVITDPAGGAPVVVVPPGIQEWTGQAAPGMTVEVVIDGVSAGQTTANDEGTWALPVELPPGDHTVELLLRDPAGDLLASGPPITVTGSDTAGDATAAVEGGATEGAPTTEAATPAATPLPQPQPTPPVGPIATAAPGQTVADVLRANPQFSTFMAAADSVGLGDLIEARSAYTVFAPTNAAFAALPEQVVDALLANQQALSQVLLYHITFGLYPTADLVVVAPSTINGRLLTITPQGNTLLVNDATIVAADITADNGVIHAIDRLLIPPLAEGVRPPVIDDSGAAVFTGAQLTIVGTAEPNRAILVELNGEPFGQQTTVGPDGSWAVSGEVTPGQYTIVAYMLDSAGVLEAISRPVALQVN